MHTLFKWLSSHESYLIFWILVFFGKQIEINKKYADLECFNLLWLLFQRNIPSAINEEWITAECCWTLSLDRLCYMVRPYYCWTRVARDRDQNGGTSIFALELILFNYYFHFSYFLLMKSISLLSRLPKIFFMFSFWKFLLRLQMFSYLLMLIY